jgi:hypothetical protein
MKIGGTSENGGTGPPLSLERSALDNTAIHTLL